MDKLKGLKDGGWHPKGKDGGKESWRGDFKGINTVAGWMGKGKSPSEAASEHQSAPLSSLTDPASFGPPPKRATGQIAPPPASIRSTTGGLGSPLSQEEIHEARRKKEAEQAAIDEAAKPREPSGPYRANTTGLSTTGLPKPPITRRADQASPPLPGRAKPPSLPPRLPPRGARDSHEPAPPPYSAQPVSHLNQEAVNRLGQAGVSVPGLGIRRLASPPAVPSRNNHATSAQATALSPPQDDSRLGELQARFSTMHTSTIPAKEGGGTTWAQKQAALRTMSDFKKDPSSVTLSDARGAASTANDFRERHGEQVASGYKAANSMNQKYGVMEKMRTYSNTSGSQQGSATTSPAAGGLMKKAAPPPPAKRSDLMAEPPPLPLSSKPKPGG